MRWLSRCTSRSPAFELSDSARSSDDVQVDDISDHVTHMNIGMTAGYEAALVEDSAIVDDSHADLVDASRDF